MKRNPSEIRCDRDQEGQPNRSQHGRGKQPFRARYRNFAFNRVFAATLVDRGRREPQARGFTPRDDFVKLRRVFGRASRKCREPRIIAVRTLLEVAQPKPLLGGFCRPKRLDFDRPSCGCGRHALRRRYRGAGGCVWDVHESLPTCVDPRFECGRPRPRQFSAARHRFEAPSPRPAHGVCSSSADKAESYSRRDAINNEWTRGERLRFPNRFLHRRCSTTHSGGSLRPPQPFS